MIVAAIVGVALYVANRRTQNDEPRNDEPGTEHRTRTGKREPGSVNNRIL
jgi:hypothetical protein